jgi:hypothetical protein
MRQHGPQELRLNLKVMIGLKLVIAPRADVVKHENDANACEDWSQQEMRAGEVKRFKSGTDNGVAKQFHGGAGRRVVLPDETSGRPLNKQLAGSNTRALPLPGHFGFDSLARVCFLSVSSAADLTFLHGRREFGQECQIDKRH